MKDTGIKFIILLSIFILFYNCNHGHENTDIDKYLILSLEKVTSNCRIDSDFSPPVPKLYFYLKFKNKSNSNYFIEMNNFLDRKRKNVEFSVTTNLNGKKVKLPLYKNTNSNIYLDGNTEDIISLVTYFRDIESVYQEHESKDICFFMNELLSKKLSFSYLNTSSVVAEKQESHKIYQKIDSFRSYTHNFIYELSSSNAIE